MSSVKISSRFSYLAKILRARQRWHSTSAERSLLCLRSLDSMSFAESSEKYMKTTAIGRSVFYIIRPPVRSNGRTYKMLVMFFFLSFFLSFFLFSPTVLRAPSTDRPETLPHDRNLASFYNATPKIRGTLPQENPGPKHAKFRSILDHFRLWSRISPERLKISKIGRRYKLWQFLLRLTKKVRWTLVH